MLPLGFCNLSLSLSKTLQLSSLSNLLLDSSGSLPLLRTFLILPLRTYLVLLSQLLLIYIAAVFTLSYAITCVLNGFSHCCNLVLNFIQKNRIIQIQQSQALIPKITQGNPCDTQNHTLLMPQRIYQNCPYKISDCWQ